MERVFVKNINVGENNKIAGFVENIRDKKNICFIILRDITGKIQLTINKEKNTKLLDIINSITIGSVIEVDGLIKNSEIVKLNGVEMIVESINILSTAEPSPIIAPRDCETNLDMRLDYRWIDLRTEKNQLMFKVQSELISSFREFLLEKSFVEIHTPKIINTESESGAGIFELEYFDKKAYLAQSPQFYKQMAMASGFERIFETGPVFRAEKSNSRKHATEFSGFDVEFSYINSYFDVMKLEEEMLTFGLKKIHDKFYYDVKKLFNVDINIPKNPFPIIDLKELYAKLKKKYDYEIDDSEKGDLTTEAEKLCEKFSLEEYDNEFLFVTGFSHKKRAFYHMRDEKGIPCGYDLIWKGVEITTGAQREHRYKILKKQAEERNLQKDVDGYLNFFKYGCPPHGGFGLGIDRLTLILFNTTIKESMFIFRGPDKLTP